MNTTDLLAQMQTERRARAAQAAAAVDPEGRLMIVAEVKKGEVVSSLHLKTCTGGAKCRITKGTVGRPVPMAHPDEIAKATLAKCASA